MLQVKGEEEEAASELMLQSEIQNSERNIFAKTKDIFIKLHEDELKKLKKK